MSGGTVKEALRERFDSVRRSEIERLSRKFAGMSEAERESVESIVARVVDAIVQVPSRALSDAHPPETLRALVHLFGLQPRH